MTLPIQVGPSTITMNRDDRFVVCQPDGRIERLAEEGFFARDTRFVSGYEVFLNGQRPAAPQRLAGPVLLVALRVHEPGAARPRRRRAPPQPRAAHRPDGLRRRPRGLRHRQLRAAPGPPDDRDRDRVRLRRHLRRQVGQLVRRGEINARWFRSTRELRTTYVHRDFVRELVIRADRSDSKPQFANGRFVFIAEVAPKGVWHTCLRWLPLTSSKRRPSTLPCNALAGPAARPGHAEAPPRPSRYPEPHRPPRLGPGPARHDLAPARGPDVRQGRLHPGGRRPVVRDALRARLAGRLDAGHQRLPGVRRRGAAPPVRAAGHHRRPRARHGAGQDPARDPPRRAGAAAHPAVPAVLRHPRRDQPVPDRDLVSLPVGRRRRAAGALPAQRRGGAALDRHQGRPRWRRVPGVQDALDARLLQPGLEGRWRRHPARRRLARAAAAGPVRAAGLRLRREAADGRHLRDPRSRPQERSPAGRGGRAVRPLQRRVLVGGRGHVLPRARRRQAADRDRGLQCRALPGERHRPARAGGPGREAPDGARHVVRLGDPDALLGPHRVQPVQLPDGLGLAARQRDDRRWLPALRP